MSVYAIICVDDQKTILDSVQNELQSILEENWKPEFAESAEEAFEIIEDLVSEGILPAIVVTDQIMPGMKGDEFLIKLHIKYPETIKILLTGQAGADAVGNVVNNSQLYRYIVKPWQKLDFHLTIVEGMKKYQSNLFLKEQKQIIEKLKSDIVEDFMIPQDSELEDHQLYKKIIFQRFLYSLPEIGKNWFIRASLGLINVDGKMNNTKLIFLSAIVSENKNKQFVKEILEKVQLKAIPELEILSVEKTLTFKILRNLTRILIENKKFSSKEQDYVIHIGGKLGIDKLSIKKVIELAKKEIIINHETNNHYLSLAKQNQVFE